MPIPQQPWRSYYSLLADFGKALTATDRPERRVRIEGLLEPSILAGGVVEHQSHYHPDAAPIGFLHQARAILVGAMLMIHRVVVRHIIFMVVRRLGAVMPSRWAPPRSPGRQPRHTTATADNQCSTGSLSGIPHANDKVYLAGLAVPTSD